MCLATFIGTASIAPPAAGFATNTFRFETMPVRWWYNPANEPPPPPGTTWEALIEAAAANWSAVGCAEVSFVYEGIADTEWADDGKNVIFWPKEWLFQAAAAAATLHDPQDEGEPREVDLALHGQSFQWTVGGGDAFQTDVLDTESVITHEFGHWLGLSHSADQFATMYAAKLIGTMQASLNSDDKFGLCTLYPNGLNECVVHEDCPPGYACHDQPNGDMRACGELRTPIGGHCSKDTLDCVGMCFISLWDCSAVCAFTETDYTDGYCAELCLNANGEERACKPGHSCQPISGYDDVMACYRDPEPEAEPDTGGDLVDGDVASDTDDAEARVVLTGGCRGGQEPPWSTVLIALGAALLLRRRRVHTFRSS